MSGVKGMGVRIPPGVPLESRGYAIPDHRLRVLEPDRAIRSRSRPPALHRLGPHRISRSRRTRGRAPLRAIACAYTRSVSAGSAEPSWSATQRADFQRVGLALPRCGGRSGASEDGSLASGLFGGCGSIPGRHCSSRVVCPYRNRTRAPESRPCHGGGPRRGVPRVDRRVGTP